MRDDEEQDDEEEIRRCGLCRVLVLGMRDEGGKRRKRRLGGVGCEDFLCDVE